MMEEVKKKRRKKEKKEEKRFLKIDKLLITTFSFIIYVYRVFDTLS